MSVESDSLGYAALFYLVKIYFVETWSIKFLLKNAHYSIFEIRGCLTTVDEADRAERLTRQVGGVRIVKGEFDYLH